MKHRIIATPDAPAAIGPYSQAVSANGTTYCSGQIALDPATGAVVEGDVRAQAEQVMKNLLAVLHAAGHGVEDIVRCTIFLVDMGDFAAVNEVYAKYFTGDTPPSRACVAAAQLPRGARVEIDCIATCD